MSQNGRVIEYPRIIQGGMGVAVSSWPLARAVSLRGQLGVVSGTGLDTVFARRLQLGDIGGHIEEALRHFPVREVAERVWKRYFLAGGKRPDAPFKSKPLPSLQPTKVLVELIVVANYVEVFLAKQDHDGLVGINLLEKIQLPTLPSLLGAMLAGVDYVLMGAGIPRSIPGVLDQFAALQPAELKIDVVGATNDSEYTIRFDPVDFVDSSQAGLKRPKFLAIVSSVLLAQILAKKCSPPVDGFVVEGAVAGGHNAPPRGAMLLSEFGEPVYGERDEPDLEKIRELGLPFWLAGSYGTHERLEEALKLGAQGIQVGTGFAFCEESGIREDIKKEVIRLSRSAGVRVFADPKASPTGFPFKVLDLPGSISDRKVYDRRKRICDLGYLRELYEKPDGTVGYRCAGEPECDFVKKGGEPESAEGRYCLCNGLMSTVGLGQLRKGAGEEPPLITAGDDVANLERYLKPGHATYTANDVLDVLLK